jgi:hypothetical protein
MRRLVLALSLCAGVLTWTVPAAAQAAAEAGLGAGASSIGTAGAGGVGKAVGGILRNLDKTINPARDSKPASSRSTAKSRRATPQPPPPPPPNYEDAAQIEKDMPIEDVLRRFGPPAMQIASGSNTQTMTYVGKSGMVQVELEAGRVISVAKPKSGA